jgi:hypothetical protein
MKTTHSRKRTLGLAICWLATACLADPGFKMVPMPMDTDGRFWIYRNGLAHPLMPFSPYGWMSDTTNLTSLIHVDLECADRPNTTFKTTRLPEKDRCIRVKLLWDDATWASIAFISGPDKPAWWGETNGGKYYNLTTLSKRKLIFYARGERGDEVIKPQLGALAGKPFGDSLSKPFIGEEIKLTRDWTRHEVDLSVVPAAELARVCNGFGVIAERSSQPDSTAQTIFYLDDIYFE